jgi:hypothetical protein
MPSHAATLLEANAKDGGWAVRARLACGCEVQLQVPEDRVLDVDGGKRVLVGKYPCPKQHPVKRPGA